jgi:hypothetical protein
MLPWQQVEICCLLLYALVGSTHQHVLVVQLYAIVQVA